MAITLVSAKEMKAFKRFLTLLPHGKDLVLVVLKGHLLIEEQLRQVVDEHVSYPEALEKTRFNCSQVICLAEAFCADRAASWLWDSVRNLNSLWNEIAHKIKPGKFHDRISDIVSTVGEHSVFTDAGSGDFEEQVRFELCLWVLFANVAAIVQRPAAESVLQSATNGRGEE